MTRIVTATEIDAPVEQVFAYVTTPGHWPEWHPSSRGVTGATDHSLEVGEQVTESFDVAGRRGTAVWTVRACEPNRRWVIQGEIRNSRSGGTITYLLTPIGSRTHFEREFVYALPGPVLAILDRLVFRRRVEAESREALRRLKGRLESAYRPGPAYRLEAT